MFFSPLEGKLCVVELDPQLKGHDPRIQHNTYRLFWEMFKISPTFVWSISIHFSV